MLEGNGPKWLFDLDSLTQSMNYVPVVAGSSSNVSAGTQEGFEPIISSQQEQDCIFMPIWKDASYFEDDSLKKMLMNAQITRTRWELMMIAVFRKMVFEDQQVKYMPVHNAIYEERLHQDLQQAFLACFISQEEPKRVSKSSSDPARVEAMQEETPNSSSYKSMVLCRFFLRVIGLLEQMWVNRNKKDERELLSGTKADFCPKDIHKMKEDQPIGACPNLGDRLISWQCKKQSVVPLLQLKQNIVLLSKDAVDKFSIIDFINRSHICYALTKKPEVCISFIKQFWRSAETLTDENGEVKIHATIDGHSLSITEGSLRRHLKLDDQDALTTLPTTETMLKVALMGYVYPTMPRNMQDNKLQQHTRLYSVPSLIMKVFSNMKRSTKGFSSQEVALFSTMLDDPEPSPSPSRITSSPTPIPYTFNLQPSSLH
ncbi:hypothetical protein Tco_0971399 [Tanacetum coccineum]